MILHAKKSNLCTIVWAGFVRGVGGSIPSKYHLGSNGISNPSIPVIRLCNATQKGTISEQAQKVCKIVPSASPHLRQAGEISGLIICSTVLE
ncbi:hypothetical protein XELAEV_18043692mg [Xenopus laevis]|uniref:Uncharacterized protein n=1 Tax=Xenopus laevis TaxID=8355 RepID=A0A974BXF1_XENLA|nr:hypothetical protein XELAEV_18043692mg [Xenopus laevis]